MMEPITLCGVVCLAAGLWVEFEPVIKAVAKAFGSSRLCAEVLSQSAARRPVDLPRMPLCFAKATQS